MEEGEQVEWKRVRMWKIKLIENRWLHTCSGDKYLDVLQVHFTDDLQQPPNFNLIYTPGPLNQPILVKSAY